MDAALVRYGELLASAPINVVSRRDRERVRETHIADAVQIARALPLPEGARCLDLGSGGGLPGIVVAILRPDVRVVCLDATRKKMAFVDAVVEELGLPNVVTFAARAETAARQKAYRETFDVIVSRAVGRLAVVAELGRAFARPGGVMAAVKGPSHDDELEELKTVLGRLDIASLERECLPGPRATWLVYLRVGNRLPMSVPRSDGLPQQRPLAEVPQ